MTRIRMASSRLMCVGNSFRLARLFPSYFFSLFATFLSLFNCCLSAAQHV